MKNIHVISTNQKSKIFFNHNKGFEKYQFSKEPFVNGLTNTSNQNISITSDEEIKEGDWVFLPSNEIYKMSNTDMIHYLESESKSTKKIILTTDVDLIQDGVQFIDNEFLEWFVKNPSCESVEVEKEYKHFTSELYDYKIIIPKEEPKQLFTDYPITELGDDEFKESPIRECELLSYDDNKYCYVKVEGIEKEVKRCYIYPQKGRCGDVDCVSIDEIKELLKEEPKQDEIMERFIANAKQQETLEEAAKAKFPFQPLTKVSITRKKREAFINGAKWQQERSYTDGIDLFIAEIKSEFKDDNWDYLEFIKERVLEKFKKK